MEKSALRISFPLFFQGFKGMPVAGDGGREGWDGWMDGERNRSLAKAEKEKPV